ncbi:MAG TPA: DUF4386 domain-containing protein [Actinomycetota bacterium]
MDPERRRSLIFGLFFMGTFVFSIPAVLIYGPVFKAHYVIGPGADHRVAIAALFEILTAICNIATAVVLFPLAKRQSESVSLGYVASRTLESTLIVVGAISLLSIVTLRHVFAGGGADATFVTAGRSLVAFHDWTFLIGPTFCAGVGNGILLGYLMYRSGLVPRPWAVLGLVGGSLCLIGAIGRLFTSTGHTTTVMSLLVAPEIVWEAFIAIYCTFHGFDRRSHLLNREPVLVS